MWLTRMFEASMIWKLEISWDSQRRGVGLLTYGLLANLSLAACLWQSPCCRSSRSKPSLLLLGDRWGLNWWRRIKSMPALEYLMELCYEKGSPTALRRFGRQGGQVPGAPCLLLRWGWRSGWVVFGFDVLLCSRLNPWASKIHLVCKSKIYSFSLN